MNTSFSYIGDNGSQAKINDRIYYVRDIGDTCFFRSLLHENEGKRRKPEMAIISLDV